MRTVTIDEKSVNAASASQLDLERLLDDLELPPSDAATKCVSVGQHGYILSRSFQPNDALLTISLERDGPLFALSANARQEAMGRILRATTRIITGKARSIPLKWRPFHANNLLSFQADRLTRQADGGKTDAGRIILNQSQGGGQRIFAFLLDRDGILDLASIVPPNELHQEALNGVAEAVASGDDFSFGVGLRNAVSLDQSLPALVKATITTDEWYDRWFTPSQRKFVDYDGIGGLRLVGPAGTGKTRALVVKCLRMLKSCDSDAQSSRMLFLTHATRTVQEVEQMVLDMEPDIGIELLASNHPRLTIMTLYELAETQMRYDLHNLSPISLDGHQGKELQAEILNSVIETFRKGEWLAYRGGCAEPFRNYMEAATDSQERRFFLWELLNEFGCVLDAEGPRTSIERRERYLEERRKSWMMSLPNRQEREVVLALHHAFGQQVREMKAIGTDQMITDFLNHLDSFKWEAVRDRLGFDGVFVDELHLFSRQERMTFRHFMRRGDTTPMVYMAYDAKQSPRDTFLQLTGSDAKSLDLWREFKFDKAPPKIELVDIFRYTPQIAKAIAAIDSQFPGEDLEEDWPIYAGSSQISSGPVPTICNLPSLSVTYSYVFARARQRQNELGRDGRVAVLCASNNLFGKYTKFSSSPLKDSFVTVSSRDDAGGALRNAKKFIFSTPEYVAGLQFDTVFLIDVNRAEVQDGPYAAAARRKFVSQIYLGASRAERVLEFYSSQEYGGPTPILTGPVFAGVVDQVEPPVARVHQN